MWEGCEGGDTRGKESGKRYTSLFKKSYKLFFCKHPPPGISLYARSSAAAVQLSIAFSFSLVSLIPLLSSIWTYFVCPLSPGISLIRTCTDYSAYVDILAPAFLTILEKLYPLEQRVSRWKWSYIWNLQEKIFYLGPMDLPSPNYTSSCALPF